MNQEQAKGNWDQFKGKVKQAYGKLTDNDLALLDGKRDEFYGRVQEMHGIAREQAEKQVKEWEKSCGCSSTDSRAA